jgi:hypothetical protein
MSKQPDSGSDSASTTEPGGSFSTNGTQPEGAVATAAPEGEATDAPTTDAKSNDEAVAAADGEATVGSAESGAGEVSQAESEIAASADSPTAADDPANFLSELVKAMQSTVGAERARLAADTDRRREEHLAAIQARRETEAQTMRSLAADDLKAIDSWADQERQRIKAERERRASALDDDLKKSLAEHGSKIDREVEGVEAAIAAYRVEVEAFFTGLDHETDPVAIARHAGQRPVFPTLAQPVAADAAAVAAASDAASADATAGSEAPAADAAVPTPVPVMDSRPGANLTAGFPAWNAAKPNASPEAPAEPATIGEAAETVGSAESAEAGVPVASAGEVLIGEETPSDPNKILHAVPSGRPLSWLRRGNDSSDHPNG